MQAIRGERVSRTPIWLMRQAGRYMASYRAIRNQAKDFIALCENAQMAAEVTMLPIQEFDLDAAIIFSDILLIGQAMGAPLSFQAGEGPIFEPVRSQKAVDNLLGVEAAEKLSFVSDAIQMTNQSLGQTPLIGFCGSPWTVATYMVEGKGSKQFDVIKAMAWKNPEVLHTLLDKLTAASIAYLKSQILAGANAVKIFDSWGGVLPYYAFESFSLNYIRKIISAIKADDHTKHCPVIVFCKGVNTALPSIAQSGADVISLDWTIDLASARQIVPKSIALQGNLDPTVLLGSPENLKHSIQMILNAYGPKPGHIFNLGHGILPQTDPQQVKRLIEWVQEISPTIHAKETHHVA